MDDQEVAREIAMQLLTVAEALRPSMPRVSDLMDNAAEMLQRLGLELERAYSADR